MTAALASLMALVARVDAVRPRPTGSPPLRVTSDRIERGAEWAVAINNGRSMWIESYGASEAEACAKARARFVAELEADALRALADSTRATAIAETARSHSLAAQSAADAAREIAAPTCAPAVTTGGGE